MALTAAACTTRDTELAHRADSVRAASDSALVDDRAGAEPAANAAELAANGARVEYFTDAALSHVADSLARGTSTGHTLTSSDAYRVLVTRRAAGGTPEIHERWTDVTTVQAGRGTLISGGRVNGGQLEGGGEHRGGVIQGGTTRTVGPGDVMVIPAGVPHQYGIAPGDSLRYITIKVRAASH